MPEINPIDRMASELADWADAMSSQIADAIKGGFAAPAAAQLSERQKLEYYTAMLFNPDGTPNDQGRNKLLQRMSVPMFAETFAAVIQAHPELQPPEPEPFVPGPGATEPPQPVPTPIGAPRTYG